MGDVGVAPGPPPPPVPFRRHMKSWLQEIVHHRVPSWWRRHWWPARIRQLDRERADWKRWYEEAGARLLQAVEDGRIEDWRV